MSRLLRAEFNFVNSSGASGFHGSYRKDEMWDGSNRVNKEIRRGGAKQCSGVNEMTGAGRSQNEITRQLCENF